MTRKRALELITSYTASGDEAGATRLYVENRISRAAYLEAVAKGRQQAAWFAKRDAANG